jgi:hypothetical protein
MTSNDVQVLGVQPFLRGLRARQLAELAEICQHVTVEAGQQLSCSGEGFDVRVNFAPEASPFS